MQKEKETAYISQGKCWSNNDVRGMEITKQLDCLPAQNEALSLY